MNMIKQVARIFSSADSSGAPSPLSVDPEAGPEIAEAVRAVEDAARTSEEAYAEAEARHRSLLDERESWKSRTIIPDHGPERERLLLAVADGYRTTEDALRELDAKMASDRRQGEVAEAKLRQLDRRLEEETTALAAAAAARDRAQGALLAVRQHLADYLANKTLPARLANVVATAVWLEQEKREIRAFTQRINRLGSWRPLPHFSENYQRVQGIESEIERRLRELPREEPLPPVPSEPRPMPTNVQTSIGIPRGSGASAIVSRGDEIGDFS